MWCVCVCVCVNVCINITPLPPVCMCLHFDGTAPPLIMNVIIENPRCSIFSKDTYLVTFNFIEHNVIQKLVYKVKYISQINGALIMFFGNSQIYFLKKLVDLIVNNMERINM